MVKCSFCKEPAIYYDYENKLYYCKNHFIKYCENKILLSLSKVKHKIYGKNIAIAFSGGKDSISLLLMLKRYARKLKINTFAITIDEGIKSYSDVRIKWVRNFIKSYDVPLHIVSFKRNFGYSLDEIVKISIKKGFIYKPCTFCGVFKRYLLNKSARELGADYLATGHNLDDEVQVFLLNAFRGALTNIAREEMITSSKVHRKLVPRVKPLYYCTEREITAYIMALGIKVPHVECPYIIFSARRKIRNWLNEAELYFPGFKRKAFTVKEKIMKWNERMIRVFKIKECKICGEPSSEDVCKTCQLLNYIKKVS